MKPVLVGVLAAFALVPAAGAQPLPPAEPPGLSQPLPTPDFIAVLAQSDEFERQEGRLAATRAPSPAVRRAAEAMVRDHGRSGSILAAAARQAGLPPPRPTGLALAQHERLQRLQSMSGAAFDRAYVAGQTRALGATLSAIDSYLKDGQPGPIRQAALKLRPIVQRHLALFRSL